MTYYKQSNMSSFKFKKMIYLFLLTMPLLFAACSDDDDKGSLIIGEGNNTAKFDGSTFSKELNVESSSSWNTSQDAAWVHTTIKENSLVVFVEPNATNSDRTTKVTIANKDGKKQVVAVEQKPANLDLEIVSREETAWMNYYEEKYEFFVYSKTNWTLAIDAAWATADVTGGNAGSTKVTVSFAANATSKDKREATVTVTAVGDKKATHKLVQRGKRNHEDATHYFYIHRGTLPVLYSGLDMLSHTKPSYLLDERKTLKQDKCPSHITHLVTEQFPNNVIDIIREIEKENPDATYAYHTDDLIASYPISIFSRLSIDTSRVKITLNPDGSGSYVALFSELFEKPGAGGTKYKQLQEEVANLYSENIKNPSIAYEATKNNIEMGAHWNAAHIFAQYSNVRYYIENKDYLISEDSYVNSEILKNNYIVLPPRALLDVLPMNQQNLFYEMVGFDMGTNSDLLNASPKPNLIILGTSTGDGQTSPAKQAACVKEVMDTYSADYDIFYKAHPADKAYLTYETDFPGLKLITPAKMPFDVFTWALNDEIAAMGGFNTTVFLTIPTDKVKFMFAKDAASVGGTLFYNIFKDRPDIYWIDK